MTTHAETTSTPLSSGSSSSGSSKDTKDTSKEAPTPEEIAATPVSVAASPFITRGEASAREKKQPPKVVDAKYIEGPGGFLAVETRRGLEKGYPGDMLISFDDGSQAIVPKEAVDGMADAKKDADKHKEEEDKKKKEEEAAAKGEPVDSSSSKPADSTKK